jgi:hypothetical protein
VLRAPVHRFAVALAGADERAALSLAARDLVEDLLPLAGELHQHYRRVRLWIDVRARPVELQLVARHLRDADVVLVLRLPVFEQVKGLRRVDGLGGQAVAFSDVAADDDGVHRHLENRPVLRDALAETAFRLRLLDDVAVEQGGSRRHRARGHLSARPEQIPLRRALFGERTRLRRRQQPEETAGRNRNLRQPAADRRPREVGLEVVELEHGRLADERRRGPRIVDTGELNHDLVVALLADLRFRDAELVDPVPHDLDRAVEILVRQLVALGRDGLQHHLEPALQVETERHAPMHRRTGDGEQGDTGQRGGEDAQDQEMSTPVGHA